MDAPGWLWGRAGGQQRADRMGFKVVEMPWCNVLAVCFQKISGSRLKITNRFDGCVPKGVMYTAIEAICLQLSTQVEALIIMGA